MTNSSYDVFISYSHDDEVWVTGTLLPRLEEAGLKVCIDYRDFQPGAPSVEEMRRAVETSRKTLLILTPAYLESAWTMFEYLILQTLAPANRARRLIPLLKETCELPLEIAYLTYIDFTRPDRQAIAWRKLLTALGAPAVQEALQTPTQSEGQPPHPAPALPEVVERATVAEPDAAQIATWRRMLDNYRQNLRLVEERMSEYVESTAVPLQLIKSKRRLEERIAELERRLAE